MKLFIELVTTLWRYRSVFVAIIVAIIY